jgi:hypothetical protein
VGVDDAIGIIDNRIAHAECALVRWLKADRPVPLTAGDLADAGQATLPERADRQLRTLLATLLSDHIVR